MPKKTGTTSQSGDGATPVPAAGTSDFVGAGVAVGAADRVVGPRSVSSFLALSGAAVGPFALSSGAPALRGVAEGPEEGGGGDATTGGADGGGGGGGDVATDGGGGGEGGDAVTGGGEGGGGTVFFMAYVFAFGSSLCGGGDGTDVIFGAGPGRGPCGGAIFGPDPAPWGGAGVTCGSGLGGACGGIAVTFGAGLAAGGSALSVTVPGRL